MKQLAEQLDRPGALIQLSRSGEIVEANGWIIGCMEQNFVQIWAKDGREFIYAGLANLFRAVNGKAASDSELAELLAAAENSEECRSYREYLATLPDCFR